MKLLLTRRHPHQRRWWQVLVRAAVVAVLIAGLAYVTLPWWMPTSLLRNWIAHDLAAQTGVDVTIADMSLSWREGVVVRGLRIACPPGHGVEPMVTVDRIRTEFSPWRYLFARRIAWMEIERPQVLVNFDENRSINIASLLKLSSPVTVDRIVVEEATGMLALRGEDDHLQLDIAHMQFQAGHLQPLGHMTVSALLRQGAESAPIHLQMDSGRMDDPVASHLESQFNDIDLARLPLLQLLPIPLEGLGGECNGSLVLQINRQGQIDQCLLDLTVNDLLVRPIGEEALPVVPRADLHVDAAFDPLEGNGRLTLRSLTVHLPEALELTGSGDMYADALVGNWRAIDSLHLDGRVSPKRLASMLGQSPQAGDLTVDGPVVFSADVSHIGPRIDLALAADAVGASVRQGDRILKPSQRRLTADLAVSVDERTWNARIQRCAVALADNEVIGEEGAVDDIRGLLDRLQADTGLDARGVLSEMTNLQWSGRWRLGDPAAVAEVFPSLQPTLAQIALRGGITGGWEIVQSGGTKLSMLMDVPGEAELTIGDVFVKPPNQAVSLQMTADLQPEPFELTNMSLDLTTGAGRVRLDDISLETAEDALTASGRLEAVNIQDFLLCIPVAAERLGDLQGGVRGHFNASLTPEAATASADLSHVQLHSTAIVQPDWSTTLAGRVALSARASRDSPTRVVQVDIAADGLDWQWQGPTAFSKPAGIALQVAFDAALTDDPDSLTVDRLAVQLAGSSLAVQEAVIVDGQLRSAQFDGAIAFGAPLGYCSPRLRELMDQWALSGQATVRGQFSRHPDERVLIAQFDGGDLSFTSPDGLTKAAHEPLAAVARVRHAGNHQPITIDIGSGRFGPIAVSGQASLTREPLSSQGRVILQADRADQLVRLLPTLSPAPAGGGIGADITWQWTPDELDLTTTLTAGELRMAYNGHDLLFNGAGEIAGVYRPADETLRVDRLMADGLRFDIGHSRGWVVAEIAGPTISLADIRSLDPDDEEPWPALTLTGNVHVIAEAIDAVQLKEWFGPTEVVVELTDGGGGGRDESGPVDSDDDNLPPYRTVTDAQQAELLAKSERLIRRVRPTIVASDLHVDAQVDHFRTYDEVVAQTFDLYNVHMAATISKGQVDLEYGGGLNSGTLRRSFAIDWSQPEPTVHYRNQIENARAAENIQAMLAYEFPGNTVTGSLSHDEDLTIPLAHMLAAASEPFFPVHQEGTGKTVAIEGWAKGQAAPEFITRVFPGLKMTKNEYKRMTAFATHLADGTAVNDSILNGPVYDTYMDGTTDADHIGRYEIGVILLSKPQSPEWNHTYRQGRVPILNFQARIEHGRLYDVDVAYPWPTETLYTVFLKNNYFYRAWIEHEKAKQAPDGPEPPQEP